MRQLSGFLSRFKDFVPPDDALKRAVAEAVHNSAGVPVGKADISLGNGVAFIKASSVAKNAIRLQRGRILDELYRAYPKAREKVRDVR